MLALADFVCMCMCLCKFLAWSCTTTQRLHSYHFTLVDKTVLSSAPEVVQVYGICICTLHLPVISVMIIGFMRLLHNERAVSEGLLTPLWGLTHDLWGGAVPGVTAFLVMNVNPLPLPHMIPQWGGGVWHNNDRHIRKKYEVSTWTPLLREPAPTVSVARAYAQLSETHTADLLWSVLSMHLRTRVKACISTSEICCNRGSSSTAWSLLSSICTLGISIASLVRTQTASQCEHYRQINDNDDGLMMASWSSVLAQFVHRLVGESLRMSDDSTANVTTKLWYQ